MELIFKTLQMYAECVITCQHICHVLGEPNIDLEDIDNRWHQEYNKYVILGDEDELTELYFNCTLLKQFGPCFCQ